MWDEVGRFHEGVEFAVYDAGNGADRGENGVKCVPDGVVERCLAVFTGEKVVAVVITELVAVAAGRWWAADGEDGKSVLSLEE